MMEKYSYKIENNIVVDGIVVDGENTNAQWAIENLGGFWVDSEILTWIGGTWTEQDGFRPPQPSPDCWWENDRWVCPEASIENNIEI